MPEKIERFAEHHNAFGFLRLLFASLVIVSHTPELVDGDTGRELFTRLTGTMSFGSAAVNGFFLISGFLITGSYLSSRSTLSYLRKRVARIYPAFVVASLVSLLIVAPLADVALTHGIPRTIAGSVAHMAVLARPMIGPALPGRHYNDAGAALNGAMWTIQYEFACYLLVVVAGAAGLLRRPALVGAAAVALLLVSALIPPGRLLWLSRDSLFPGPPAALFSLSGMFATGAAFYLLQDRLRASWPGAGVAALGLALTLPVPLLSNLGYGLFGGYLIFAAARGGGRHVARADQQPDRHLLRRLSLRVADRAAADLP